jgi:transposase
MNNAPIEVITSVQRRRRWSALEKERLVAASLEPGAGVSAVARQAGIHPGQLYGWRRELCQRSQSAAPSFAAVRLAAEPAPAPLPAAGTIEVEFTNGSRMRITGAVDPATLTTAVAMLASGGRRR